MDTAYETYETATAPAEISTSTSNSRPIVPSGGRASFLGERWIASRACVVQTFILTTDLLVDVSFSAHTCRFTARYCYEDAEEALLALRDWDGVLDPPGQGLSEEVSQRRGPGSC